MSSRPLFVEPLLHLRTLAAFESLSHAQLTPLAYDIEEVLLPRGASILMEGAVVPALHLIVDGEVDVGGEGGEVVGAGGSVGWLEVLSAAEARTSAAAATDVVAFRLSSDALRNNCEQNFALLSALLSYIAGRIVDFPEALLPAVDGGKRPAGVPLAPGLDRVGRMVALHRAPSFPSASMDALSELAGHAREIEFRAGELLWSAGEPAERFYVLCGGEVTLRGDGWGVPSIVGAGAVPGLVATVAGVPLTYEAEASAVTLALAIEAEPFIDVLEDHFEMAFGLLARLAGRLLAAEPGP